MIKTDNIKNNFIFLLNPSNPEVIQRLIILFFCLGIIMIKTDNIKNNFIFLLNPSNPEVIQRLIILFFCLGIIMIKTDNIKNNFIFLLKSACPVPCNTPRQNFFVRILHRTGSNPEANNSFFICVNRW